MPFLGFGEQGWLCIESVIENCWDRAGWICFVSSYCSHLLIGLIPWPAKYQMARIYAKSSRNVNFGQFNGIKAKGCGV